MLVLLPSFKQARLFILEMSLKNAPNSSSIYTYSHALLEGKLGL